MTSILDQFGKRTNKNGRKEPPMVTDNDAPPRFLSAPHDRQQPARQSSTRASESYARAVQQHEDLENELRDAKAKYEIEIQALRKEHDTRVHALQTEIHECRGRLATVEKANEILNVDCETLRARGEDDKANLTMWQAELEVAMKIILDLHNKANSRRRRLTPEQDKDAEQAVADAVGG